MPRALLRIVAATLPAWVELYLLRFFIHQEFGPNNIQIGIYGRDVYLPLFIGLIASIAYLDKKHRLKIHVNLTTFAGNLLSLALFFGCLHYYDSLVTNSGPFFASILFLLATLGVFLSGFLLFLSARQLVVFGSMYRKQLGLLLAALVFLIAYPSILSLLWPTLTSLLAGSLFYSLHALGFDVIRTYTNYSVVLQHADLVASIGMGCSGMEGIFIFIYAYLLYRVFSNSASWLSMCFEVVGGCALALLLNYIRIVLFFGIGVWINQTWGESRGTLFFIFAFHENLGWLIYLLGFGAFFYFRRAIREQKWDYVSV